MRPSSPPPPSQVREQALAAEAAPANSIDQSFDFSSAPPLCTAGTSGCLLPKQRPRPRADVVHGEPVALQHLASRRGCANAVAAEYAAAVADIALPALPPPRLHHQPPRQLHPQTRIPTTPHPT